LRVALNMIASVDGRIAVKGRSAALGGPADGRCSTRCERVPMR